MGTWPLNGVALALLVRKAVALGYRVFDAASAYGNERWLGCGMKIAPKRRSELFISTKLSNSSQRSGDVAGALRGSLSRLGTKYVDLYLMHWPYPGTYVAAWKQMEALYSAGLARAIGVCNFHQHHLDDVLRVADVVPAVNQVELHPLLCQAELVYFCRGKGIQIQSYSPLARMHPQLVANEVIVAMAERHHRTVPQIILRWNVQHGYASVPKASCVARLRENISVFDFVIPDEDMRAIDSLNANLRVRHDPDNCDYAKL